MAQIIIDGDALYRAVTSTGYKLLAWHLDLSSGEILSRTLRPEEVEAPTASPSVKPLPKLGGDLSKKKELNLFGPTEPVAPNKKLFNDDVSPSKTGMESSFFKRDEKKKIDPFGDGGFKKESGSKKLAEIFAEKEPTFAANSALMPAQKLSADSPAFDAESHPRIPVASEHQQSEWRVNFARDCGDPQIREELGRALAGPQPMESFERILRKNARLGQQWERYHRKQALVLAEAWLKTLPLTWELVEK